jgi:hypothetical protein
VSAARRGGPRSRPTAPLAGGSTSGGPSLAARIFAWDDRHHPRAEHLAALQCAVADTTGLVVRGVLEVHGGGGGVRVQSFPANEAVEAKGAVEGAFSALMDECTGSMFYSCILEIVGR